MAVESFKMPDVGEGLTEADILSWRVAVGDTVEVNQVIVEVETAKAAVELPSPYAGVVTALHAQDGQTVNVGAPIISIETGGNGVATAPPAAAGVAAAGPAAASAASAVAAEPAATGVARAHAAASGAASEPTDEGAVPYGVFGEGEPPKRQPVLVGYGPAAETAAKRRRRTPGAVPSAHSAFNTAEAPPAPPAVTDEPVIPAPAPLGDVANRLSQAAAMPAAMAHRVLAKPPVRKLAKSLGVDLARVRPTGPNGTVSRDDVNQAAQGGVDVQGGVAVGGADTQAGSAQAGSAQAGSAPATGTQGGAEVMPAAASGFVPAYRPGARESRVPVRGVRKHTAAAMVSSAFTAPHVTEFVTIDISATMDLRDRVAARREFAGVKVSPLLFVARAVILAAAHTPEINATWDAEAGEIVLKHYVNLGIAAATQRGLVVPNIKDADTMSLRALAIAIGELTDTARAGRTAPADMLGGTITITNVGVFGVDTGTPILNPGETGIVAFGAVRRMPWVVTKADGTEAIEPRWVTNLAVSFDHRVVDGQQGSQFLSDVAAVLTDPGLALL